VLIRNVVEDHLLPIILKLRECGIEISSDEPPLRLFDLDRNPHSLCSLRVLSRTTSCKPVHVTAAPHPGFPTDAHPVIAAMLTMADGPSIITETVYDRRFRYCSELQRMGARITVNGQNAILEGSDRLTGARVCAPDLRGGAALVLAGLVAEGETEITGLHYIDRGYEAFVPKLQQLGANIKRVSAECAVLRPALCFA
jgi:UDP-N-acetylglucosamine 1-carboxyvinyltransferase